MLHFFATSVFPKNHFSVCHFAGALFHIHVSAKWREPGWCYPIRRVMFLALWHTLLLKVPPKMAWKMCFPDGFGGEKTRKRLIDMVVEVQFFPLSMSLCPARLIDLYKCAYLSWTGWRWKWFFATRIIIFQVEWLSQGFQGTSDVESGRNGLH